MFEGPSPVIGLRCPLGPSPVIGLLCLRVLVRYEFTFSLSIGLFGIESRFWLAVNRMTAGLSMLLPALYGIYILLQCMLAAYCLICWDVLCAYRI